jgi:hypothetical protein
MRHILKKILWAFFFITLGTVILLANYQALPFPVSLRLDWPVILIFFGISKLIDAI